mgnify:FL=1
MDDQFEELDSAAMEAAVSLAAGDDGCRKGFVLDGTILQEKSSCAAGIFCRVRGVMLSDLVRCDYCGLSCHGSCRTQFTLETEGHYRYICSACSSSLCLPVSKGRNPRKSILISDVDKANEVRGSKRARLPLKLLATGQYEKMFTEACDGVNDPILGRY